MCSGNRTRRSLKQRFGRVDLRIALIFLLFFTLASGLMFGFSLLFLYNSFRATEIEAAQGRLLHYWALFQSGGVDPLMEEIGNDTAIFEERPFFIRIADGENRTLFLRYPAAWDSFGIEELERYPAALFEDTLRLRSKDDDTSLEVFSLELADHLLLQLGMSNARSQMLIRIYRRNFLALLGGLIILGFLFALLLSGRILSPIRTLNQGMKAIVATDDFSRRVETRGVDDELDDLIRLFNDMVRRIDQLLFRMRDNVDTLAHDLRTPLTIFRNSAEEALLDPGTGEKASRALSTALEQSERILSMMNTIMDITEAEAGTLQLHRRETDLFALVSSVGELYAVLAQERGIKVHVTGSPIFLHGDPARLEQAVGNLLDNGVKYSPPGGWVELKLFQEGDRAVIEVADQGPGIAEEELPHIFERLYRGSAARNTPGTGLGLGLVRAVARSHGGDVEVKSPTHTKDASPGGSKFRICLPLHDEKAYKSVIVSQDSR